MERWAILCNQTSGSYDPRRLEAIRQVLRARGVDSRVVPTAYRGHATDLCRGMSDVDTVAVYAGDGTLNEAANGLLGRELPLAFLPGGTANVMAHELGLPQDPVRAAQALVAGEVRTVVPGLIGERAFLLMAGFGFDGMAVHRVSPRLKARTGKLAYVWAGLQAFAARHATLRLTNGDAALRPAHWAVVSRAAHYGGPFLIDREAGLERPELSLTAMAHRTVLPFLVANLGLGLRRPAGSAQRQHGTDFRVQADVPVCVQVDGDAFPPGRDFSVALSPRPIRLRFPAGARE